MRRIAGCAVHAVDILPSTDVSRASGRERVCRRSPPSELLSSEYCRAMGRHDSALAVDQSHLRVLDLARAAFAAQLTHRLGDRKERTGMAWMTMREQATVCIDRKFTAEFDASAFDEAAALSLGTEAEILELDYHDRGEAIVKLGDVDIVRPNSRHRVGAFARFFGGRRRQADGLADVLVRMALARAEQINRFLLEVAGALGGGHNDCRAAVTHERAIEQMERVADHPRVEHVVDRDGLAHLRGRIHRRMLAACDGNSSALRCGG